MYCLDFGGGSLSTLRDLPHVGGASGALDAVEGAADRRQDLTLLADREQRFASSASTRWCRTGSAGPTRRRIRGCRPVRRRVPRGGRLGHAAQGLRGAGAGHHRHRHSRLSYGIHVVAAATRWMDFRPAIRDLFGSRLELRLGDPTDSMINRRAALNVPEKPGRGLAEHPTDKNKSLHLLTVRPELSTLGDTADLVKAIATNWSGAPAPRVRLLPATLPYATWIWTGRPACACRSGSPKRTCSRSTSTSRATRTSCCSATPNAGRRRSCVRWPPRWCGVSRRSRPGSSWSTIGAA